MIIKLANDLEKEANVIAKNWQRMKNVKANKGLVEELSDKKALLAKERQEAEKIISELLEKKNKMDLGIAMAKRERLHAVSDYNANVRSWRNVLDQEQPPMSEQTKAYFRNNPGAIDELVNNDSIPLQEMTKIQLRIGIMTPEELAKERERLKVLQKEYIKRSRSGAQELRRLRGLQGKILPGLTEEVEDKRKQFGLLDSEFHAIPGMIDAAKRDVRIGQGLRIGAGVGGAAGLGGTAVGVKKMRESRGTANDY